MNDAALKRIIAPAITYLCALVSAVPAQADSLFLDESFRPPLFAEPYPAIRSLLLSDGKLLLYLNNETLADQRTGAIIRLLPNGDLDTSFNFTSDYRSVAAAAVTSNGQLIIAALQYNYTAGYGTEQILRLNA